MRLRIDNFAKIKQADILVDGITVIAGENNTGKSTIGKILFCIFNSISDIDEKIKDERIDAIARNCYNVLRNYIAHGTIESKMLRITPRFFRDIKVRLKKLLDENANNLSDEIIGEGLLSILMHYSRNDKGIESDYEKIIQEMIKRIRSILELSEDKLKKEIIARYFGKVFNSQINSLIEKESNAEVKLIIKDKFIGIGFEKDDCISIGSDIALINKAVYIDNPFIIDELSDYSDSGLIEEFLKDILTNTEKDIMDGLIESVIAKEKMGDIYDALGHVLNGKIIKAQDEEFYFQKEGFEKPVSFKNLSTGLKSFIILKMLIENNVLTEKDVLILDEPEIHLHPQWQIAYAELIVLLQKYFDLSIVVTTHSPYFLDAINLYSVKYGLDKKVNFYLSSMIGNEACMEKVTDNIEQIYDKMASPIQELDSLRHELNNV